VSPRQKLGIIAGNGKFPLLVLDAARAQGLDIVVAAIKEETSPEIDQRASAAGNGEVKVHWMSLGELSRLIKTFQAEGVTQAIMAGQVKHKQIFSSIRPDWKLARLLFSLRTRNTDSLIGAVANLLGQEGITLRKSTDFLEPLLAKAGLLSRRSPSDKEKENISYGREVARHLVTYDIGQTVVIAESACVAVEAMDGTDATILRAGEIMRSLHADLSPENASTLSRALTVVKVSKPNQDMRFDVPVVGVATMEVMRRAGATCLALDAGKCLLIDGDAVVRAADDKGIAILAE
jgi:UDP-2,3-diacylglucosamine hydrolase